MNKIDLNHIEYENYNTQLYDKVYFNTDSGGYVVVHKLHGKQERAENVEIAKILADAGKRVELLPISDVQGMKNPDAKVDGMIFEFKENKTPTFSAIEKEIRKAKNQADNILLYFRKAMKTGIIKYAIKDRVYRTPDIKNFILIWKGVVYEFSKKEIKEGVLDKKIQ